MVHIRHLKLKGFKSFNRPTQVEFRPGLNCIVGSNGSGKCLDADAEIILADGSKRRIGEIVESELQKSNSVEQMDDGFLTKSNPNGLKVFSLNPHTLKIEKKKIAAFVKRKSPEYMLKITMRSGKEIIATPYHPFFTVEEGKVKSIRAEDIIPGKPSAAPRFLHPIVKTNSLNFAEYFDFEDNLYVPYSQHIKEYVSSLKTKGTWKQFAAEAGVPYLAVKGLIDGQSINLKNLNKIASMNGGLSSDLVPEIKCKTATEAIKFPYNMTNELARFYGYMISEGRNTPSNQMWFVNSDEAVINDFCEVTASSFGKMPRVFNYKPLCSDVILFSGAVCKLSEKVFGFGKETSAFKKVPPQIFTASNEVVSNFLGALFTGDGYICLSSKRSRSQYIEYSSASKQLAKDIASLLLRFGILSSIRKKLKCATNTEKKIKRAYYSVYIYGIANLKKFADNITLIGEKQVRLEAINALDLIPNPNVDLIPNTASIVRSLIKETKTPVKPNSKLFPRIKPYYYQQCELSRNGILGILKIIGTQHSDLPHFRQLKKLAESDIFWDAVETVEKINPTGKWVYDLCVEDNHNFVAEGIFVHNSNILDSLKFGLGQLSSKTLRADNYSDLIFKKKGRSSEGEAVVYYEIDNRDRTIPVDTSIVQVARMIRPNGSTQYKLNGRGATRQQVVDMLAHARISPEGHNIIMQGDVSRFVEMKPTERRQIVEEIAGISHYEEQKLKALQDLDNVDKKLKEANIVLKEKETYLDELFEEKKEAERYRSLNQELRGAKATKIRLEMDKINHSKNLSEKELKENESKIKALHSEKEKLNSKISALNKQIEEIEKDIEKKGGEGQLALQKTIENLKVSIENSKNVLNNSKRELDKIAQRKRQLSADLKELSVRIKKSEASKSQLEQQKKDVSLKIKTIKKSISGDSTKLKKLQGELENIEQKLEELATSKGELVSKINKLDSQREILFYKLKNAETEVRELREKQAQIAAIQKDKSRYRDLISQVNELSNQDNKLASEIADLRKEKTRLDESIADLKVNANAASALAKRDRAVAALTKAGIKGILGTVAELGKVDSKFAKALKTAAGGRMKNIVVSDENTAIRCLNQLKKDRAGTATFLPLNKIRGVPKRPVTKSQGVYGLASELITYNKKYANVFNYVFGNTIVVEDANVAKSLGIGKYKMVTLDGDVFQISGAITGGFISKDVGLGFQQTEIRNELDSLVRVRKRLISQIDNLERKREELEKKTLALRREKSELEGKIESVGRLGEVSLEDALKSKKELEELLKDAEKKKRELQKQSEEASKAISFFKASKQSLSSKIKAIQFGDKNEQVKELEEQEHELATQLATASAQLENGLIPEKRNIERVLKGLDKEETDFSQQAELKAKEIVAKGKELASLESEEKEAYGKLKQLFSKKAALREELKGLSKSVSSGQNEVSELEELRNELSIQKAKIESKLSGLQEELSQLGNPPSLPYIKSINAATNKIKELNGKLAGMGNVNMKALEIYEGLRDEYDKLVWKVQTLSREEGEIHKVIDEIEKKKKGAFMESFDKLAKNFSELYSKITEKGSIASLQLENPQKPFEGGLQVILKQEGKLMSVSALSGGEKVLAALALIFAIQEFNPAPFYLLDEIDAALDNVNSEKISKLLKEYSKKAQIIMVSHNDSLISAADYLYGVSKNKQGESKIVSLEL